VSVRRALRERPDDLGEDDHDGRHRERPQEDAEHRVLGPQGVAHTRLRYRM
jgi:hypothetical protein